jgi:hypothetical protein
MRRALVATLTIAGLVCLVLFLSFEAKADRGWSTFRVGQPDHRFVWQNNPNGHSFEMNLLRWSMGLGILGVFSLYYAVRLARSGRAKSGPKGPAFQGTLPDDRP